MREALRLLFEADELKARRLEQLNTDIKVGLDQLDRGEGVDGEQFRRRAMTRFPARP